VFEDIAYLTRELGRWHPDTRAARSTVFWWLTDEGLQADVLRLSEAEVAETTAEFGADVPETLRMRRSLAWHRRGMGDLDRAETHRCRSTLAQFLAESGEPAEAVRLLRALYTESQIAAERGTIYGVDENLGDYEMKHLQEWRRRLVAKAAST
jgi:hypothetical protein